MTQRIVVLVLFVLYFVAAVVINLVIDVRLDHRALDQTTVSLAIGEGIALYGVSGLLPFAIWGARGFRAARWASLFVPWAFFAVVLTIIGLGR